MKGETTWFWRVMCLAVAIAVALEGVRGCHNYTTSQNCYGPVLLGGGGYSLLRGRTYIYECDNGTYVELSYRTDERYESVRGRWFKWTPGDWKR